MKVFYLVPNSEKPSWGLAILYYHVKMLVQNGFNATIIKETPLQEPNWLDVQVPIEDVKTSFKTIKPSDYLVVPEVMVNFKGLKELNCKKIIFIQAAAFLFESMPKDEDHISLGFSHAFIILPHMSSIVERHIQLSYTIIPPFVSNDFFIVNDKNKKRKKKILLYPKFNIIDFSIVKYLIERFNKKRNTSWIKNMVHQQNWEVVELVNLSHKEVAKQMQEASFFISINNFEALNTSVVEAMAAGCVVFCYEGFGPRDYLKNEENALVFPNNEAYKLVETIFDWIENFETRADKYNEIQDGGYQTARRFKYQQTETELLAFFRNYSSN